jgi:hypothetical protein
VSCLVESSDGESVMQVMAGVGELLRVAAGMVVDEGRYTLAAIERIEILYRHSYISPEKRSPILSRICQ